MSGPGLPPEIAAMIGGQSAPGQVLPQDGTTAGAEAVAQSEIAAAGLKAWEECKNSGRCTPEQAQAMIAYILAEGPGAPEAAEMTKYLQARGFRVPGMADTGGDYDEA